MYKIISGGEEVTITESPRYIKVKPSSGAYIQSTKEEAQGISVLGTPYNLTGHTEITRIVYDEETQETRKEIAPEAIVLELDGGGELMRQQESQERQDAQIEYIAMMTDVDLEE